jgi:tRNA pseudouridine13 synthase
LNKAEIGDYVVSVERSGLPMTKNGKLVTAGNVSEINDSIKAGKIRIALPLVGFGQKLSEGEMGRIEMGVLEEESVELASFRVQQMPQISGKGGLRPVISPVRGFQHRGCFSRQKTPHFAPAQNEFMLLRGSYATMLLREIMKPHDPIEAGF